MVVLLGAALRVNVPLEAKQRDSRQGLGARHGKLTNKHKTKQIIKPGEKRIDPLNIIPLKAFQMRAGALVHIVKGASSGLYARVLSFSEEEVTVRLQMNATVCIIQ